MQIKSKEIVMVPVGELIPWEKNVNVHTVEQLGRLKKLIEYQGFRDPLIVQAGTNIVVAGHGRLECAKGMGMKVVPVTYQEFDSEAQMYAFMVSHNAIGKDSWATLDLSMINTDMLDFGPDFDLDMLGIMDFVVEPIEKLDPQCDEDEVPENVETRCKPGDVWVLGKHRLMCGDSTSIDAVEKLMAGNKADMLHTDPPYNVNMQRSESIQNDDLAPEAFEDLLRETLGNAAMCSGDNWLVWIGWRAFGLAHSICGEHRKVRNCVAWVKPSIGLGQPGYRYQHELGVFCGEIASRSESDVWQFGRDSSGLHPTMKPVEMVAYALEHGCKIGGSVLDLFGGSGSTLIACEKTSRRCFMMELDPKYCDVILSRWENYTGQAAVMETARDTI